jgi:SAM-dependent methyltransferase
MGSAAIVYDDVHTHLKDYRREARLVDIAIRSHSQSDGTDLLDVGCGTGLHAQHLISRYNVTGADYSRSMLQIAAHRLGTDAQLVQCDMRVLELPNLFDAVTCLFASIGTMRNRSELDAAIVGMAKHLKPGGVLLVEPWVLLEDWPGDGVRTDLIESRGIARIVRMTRDADTSLLEMHHFVGWPQAPRYVASNHALTLFTRSDYEAAFATAGLSVTHDEHGLMGRGMFVGVAPASTGTPRS